MEGSQQIVELGASAVCVGCISMLSAIISRKCSRTGGESGTLAGLCYACVRSIRCRKPSYLPLVTFITSGTLATQKRLINPNRADYGVDCMDSTFVVRPQTAAHHDTPLQAFAAAAEEVRVFSESWMWEICVSGSMSGNRKLGQAKPD